VTYVVDASVAVLWFSNEPDAAIAAELFDRDDALIAPDLLVAEAANAFWKKTIRGELKLGLADQALDTLVSLGMVFVPAAEIARDAVQLAARLNHPVYDCLYLILAEREQATLATFDKRLRAAATKKPGRSVPLWPVE
jgi:predicted nucleic acid-binding protein